LGIGIQRLRLLLVKRFTKAKNINDVWVEEYGNMFSGLEKFKLSMDTSKTTNDYEILIKVYDDIRTNLKHKLSYRSGIIKTGSKYQIFDIIFITDDLDHIIFFRNTILTLQPIKK
jgi:hypothetical protein